MESLLLLQYCFGKLPKGDRKRGEIYPMRTGGVSKSLQEDRGTSTQWGQVVRGNLSMGEGRRKQGKNVRGENRNKGTSLKGGQKVRVNLYWGGAGSGSKSTQWGQIVRGNLTSEERKWGEFSTWWKGTGSEEKVYPVKNKELSGLLWMGTGNEGKSLQGGDRKRK